jgi:hypothetical protein
MKHYRLRSELRFAMNDAAEGGQALFTHIWSSDSGPRWFRGTKLIGKLFDQDAVRLCETARALGVDPIIICRPGERGQHIDLADEPLRRAIEMSQAEAPTGED